jgi:hypothetical protein
MAYCPNCAAVLDPTQKFCARCGQPSTIFVPTAPLTAAPVAGDRPSSVKIGTGLVLLALVIGLLSFFRIFLSPSVFSRLGFSFWLQFFGIRGIEAVLIICVWKRQGWARIALVAMLVWAIYNLIERFIYYGARDPISYAFPVFLELIRIAALVFLFKPESNAWYKR